MHAIRSELIPLLLPIQEGLLLGIKIPFRKKVPHLIRQRRSQLIPAVHVGRRKAVLTKHSQLNRFYLQSAAACGEQDADRHKDSH
jgi:hypothetical protein